MYNHLEKGQGTPRIRSCDHEKLWADEVDLNLYIPCFPRDSHTPIDKGLSTHYKDSYYGFWCLYSTDTKTKRCNFRVHYIILSSVEAKPVLHSNFKEISESPTIDK